MTQIARRIHRKSVLLALTLIVAPLGLASNVRAGNSNQVERLLVTKQCRGCNLNGA
jgi:hypothetical protein